MTCRIKNRKFSLKALAKWLRTEKFYFDSLTLNVCGRQNFLIFNAIQYYVTILVEEKRLRSFVEWWVLSGHMTQIILTSSLQTIWWKYWPSTCVSGEMNDFLFFFFWNFQQLSYRCEVVFHVKSVEKNTINKRICVATLNVIFLRVVNYWALHKLCNSNKTSDILCAVTFQDCSYY